MEAKLVIVGGKANKGQISLKLPTIIGRSREAGLTVAHAMVSRHHCELFEVDGLLKVRDLGSLNGTFVGQEKVTEANLYPETEFTVGPLTFRVEYEYSGPVAGPPLQPAEVSPGEQPTADFTGLPDFLAVNNPPQEAPTSQTAPGPTASPEPAVSPAADAAMPDFLAVAPQAAEEASPEQAEEEVELVDEVPAPEPTPPPPASARATTAHPGPSTSPTPPTPPALPTTTQTPATVEVARDGTLDLTEDQVPELQAALETPPAEPNGEAADGMFSWMSGEAEQPPALDLPAQEAVPEAAAETPPAPADAPEASPPVETFVPPAAPALPAKKPAKPKDAGWWPFGKGKKQEKPKAKTPTAPPPAAPPPAPASAAPATSPLPTPASDGVPDFLAANPPAEAHSQPPAVSDDDIDDFLKGLQ